MTRRMPRCLVFRRVPCCLPQPNIYGYARVSTEDQELSLQITALTEAAVARKDIVQEKAKDLDARGVRIVITTLGVDLKTPAGRLVYGVLAQIRNSSAS